MAVSLVRIKSDTPIQNTDDVRAFKFCTLGANGVVAGYLNEVGYEVSGLDFTLKSGEIIIDGWQVKIDGSGATVTANSTSSTQYYSVYCEIDLSNSSAKSVSIKSSYNTSTYPTIDTGDDISVVTMGTARLELYRFTLSGGSITDVTQMFEFLDGQVTSAKNADNTKLVQNVDFSSDEASNFGNYIVEKKMCLFNETTWLTANGTSVTLNGSVQEGDLIEIQTSCGVYVGVVNESNAVSFNICNMTYLRSDKSYYSLYDGYYTLMISNYILVLQDNVLSLNMTKSSQGDIATINLFVPSTNDETEKKAVYGDSIDYGTASSASYVGITIYRVCKIIQ